MGVNPSLGWSNGLPPIDSSPSSRTRREEHVLPIVRMSSGRLFLDRVGRHQSSSPLYRQAQANMHFSEALQNRTFLLCWRIGHFYFAATKAKNGLLRQSRNVPFEQSRNVPSAEGRVRAIPTIGIVLHHVQPSRLPFGAKAGGLDGASTRCTKCRPPRREWRRCSAIQSGRRDISTLPERGTFLLCGDYSGPRNSDQAIS